MLARVPRTWRLFLADARPLASLRSRAGLLAPRLAGRRPVNDRRALLGSCEDRRRSAERLLLPLRPPPLPPNLKSMNWRKSSTSTSRPWPPASKRRAKTSGSQSNRPSGSNSDPARASRKTRRGTTPPPRRPPPPPPKRDRSGAIFEYDSAMMKPHEKGRETKWLDENSSGSAVPGEKQ